LWRRIRGSSRICMHRESFMERKRKGRKIISIAALYIVIIFLGSSVIYAAEISDDLTNEVKEENESRFSKG